MSNSAQKMSTRQEGMRKLPGVHTRGCTARRGGSGDPGDRSGGAHARALQGSRHLGISELGAILELPPSTVHGIVKSLQTHGLVAKEPHGQRYMLGPDAAAALQRLPRHPRRAGPGHALDRRPQRAHRAGGAAGRGVLRRGDRHPPRAPSRRQPADAGDRPDDPGARVGAGQGAARLPARTSWTRSSREAGCAASPARPSSSPRPCARPWPTWSARDTPSRTRRPCWARRRSPSPSPTATARRLPRWRSCCRPSEQPVAESVLTLLREARATCPASSVPAPGRLCAVADPRLTPSSREFTAERAQVHRRAGLRAGRPATGVRRLRPLGGEGCVWLGGGGRVSG